MLVDWLSVLFGALCVYLQTSISDGALPNKRQMDQLIKGVKWNWEHQKTYAVVKSGSGYIDVDVVSKYRLDGRSKLPTTKPPRPPTKKTVKPPRPPTNKNPPKPPPRPTTNKNKKINPRPPTQVGGSKNLALGKKTYMSSVYGRFGGQYCVNGNTKDFCHTRTQRNPWLRIDLGAVNNVDKVVIYNRNVQGGRFRNAFIHVGVSINRLRKCGYFRGPGKNSQKITIKCPGGMKGRFIQIQARANTILQLADVQVFGNPGAKGKVGGSKNLALGKKTYMSSVYGRFGGQYCVNGNTKDFCHTRTQRNPWLRIDLGAVNNVDKVVIYNRNVQGGRFRNAFIHVGVSINRLRKCGYFRGPGKNSQKITIKCPGGMKGRFIQIQARANTILQLADVQVFGNPGAKGKVGGSKNLALGKKTYMSSVYGRFGGQYCVNGNTKDFCHTRTQRNPWLRIDLGAVNNVDKVVIYNRNVQGGRFRNAFIHVGVSINRLRKCGYFRGPGKNSQKITIKCPGGMKGRFIQIQARANTILQLADVQVFGNPGAKGKVGGSKNLALGKKTYMSSVYGSFRGHYCVNGNTKDFCHTRTQRNPWLRIDLGAVNNVDKVVIYNRNVQGGRFRNAFIHVGVSINRLRKCGYFRGPGKNSQKITIKCPGGMKGRFIQIQARAKTILQLADVQVFGG
ncbi:uncharacterized isoform X1 [Magallana gigas]|uniref:uncharacterized isoform X1 n=1 Tax=Magallana gigas TaxID=29159 RepID=UPI003340F9DB